MISDINLTINTPVYRRWRFQIFVVTWLAYFGFYLTRKSFIIAKIGIQLDPSMRSLTAESMGWIDGCFLAAYTIGQLVFGIAGDRMGTRKVVAAGMLCSVIAAVAMGVSSLTVMMGVIFFIQGLAQSTGWGPLVKNVGSFFLRRERGFVLGLWCTSYAVGGMIASIYAGYWGDRFGWRYAFFMPAATLLVIWVLFMLFQRNSPEDVGLPVLERDGESDVMHNTAGSQSTSPSWKNLVAVIADRHILLFAAMYFFIKPIRYALLFWGPAYIHARLGTGMARSGFISSLFDFAGVLSDKLFASKRIPVCSLSMLSLGFLLFFMHRLPATSFMLGAGYMVIGFLVYAPDSVISAIAPVDFGVGKRALTAVGFVNCMGSIGAIIGGTVPGFFAHRWGWHGVFLFLGVLTAAGG